MIRAINMIGLATSIIILFGAIILIVIDLNDNSLQAKEKIWTIIFYMFFILALICIVWSCGNSVINDFKESVKPLFF